MIKKYLTPGNNNDEIKYMKNYGSYELGKNDLPSYINNKLKYKYYNTKNYIFVNYFEWRCKGDISHRDNDLPKSLIQNISYSYNKYDTWYRYNGYTLITNHHKNTNMEFEFKFIKGICLEFLLDDINY